jgi:polysaccharide lyase-like protein
VKRSLLGLIGVAILLYGATTVRSTPSLLWSANHERGSEVEWYRHFGGGEFDSGCAGAQPSREVARSGRYSLQLTIGAPCGTGSSGSRMFRWRESRRYSDLYYRVWYYLPQLYTVTGSGIPGDDAFWSVLQWKSRAADPPRNDPFFMLNIANRPDGNMFLYLYDSNSRVSHGQTVMDVPVGRWLSIEAVYKSREDATGQVTIWQDGTLLWDITGVQTRYPDSQGGVAEWSVINYSNGVTPAPTIFFVDDAEIRYLDGADSGIHRAHPDN